jgi:1-deoxy-D-xylulose-5-phosphate synthase
LDGNLLCDWARKTGKVITVEENVLQGGFGSAILELFQERGLFSIPLKRLGIPDIFVEHGPQALLREKYGIDENGIFKEVKEMVEQAGSESIHTVESESPESRVFPTPNKFGRSVNLKKG